MNHKVVVAVMHSIAKTGITPKDGRGRQRSQPVIRNNLRHSVLEHIQSFQTVPSHYCRQYSQSKYQPNSLSLKEMYILYLQHCQEKHITPSTESIYPSIFYKDFNISFHIPPKDLCHMCEKYSTHKKEMICKKNMKYTNITNKNQES